MSDSLDDMEQFSGLAEDYAETITKEVAEKRLRVNIE